MSVIYFIKSRPHFLSLMEGLEKRQKNKPGGFTDGFQQDSSSMFYLFCHLLITVNPQPSITPQWRYKSINQSINTPLIPVLTAWAALLLPDKDAVGRNHKKRGKLLRRRRCNLAKFLQSAVVVVFYYCFRCSQGPGQEGSSQTLSL